jgi:polar amino acid transport system substrate-binding protein
VRRNGLEFARPRLVTLSIGLVLVVAACGSSSSPSSSASATGNAAAGVTKQASIAAEVPSALQGSPLQIATDATYAPNEYVDPNSGDIVGWDVQLGDAVCKVMGETCTFNNVTFDDIIAQLKASTPSEQAGGDKPRYQFSVSSWTPTAKREQSGIDFITYYQAGEQWLVRPGGPSISTAADMCGHKVAVEAGTVEESDAWGYMGESVGGSPISGDTNNCKAAGKPDITVDSYQSQTQANEALISGRDDFGWADQPIADYQVKVTGGKVKLGGQPCSIAPYGIAIVHGSALETAIEDALKYLIQSGSYGKLLSSWDVQSGAIPASQVTLNNNSSVGSTCVPSY